LLPLVGTDFATLPPDGVGWQIAKSLFSKHLIGQFAALPPSHKGRKSAKSLFFKNEVALFLGYLCGRLLKEVKKSCTLPNRGLLSNNGGPCWRRANKTMRFP
jgi:hypothetical protein